MGKCMQTIVTPAFSSGIDGERVVERSHPWDRWSSPRHHRRTVSKPRDDPFLLFRSSCRPAFLPSFFLSFFLSSSRPHPLFLSLFDAPHTFLARERDNRAYVSSIRLSGRSMPFLNRDQSALKRNVRKEREREREDTIVGRRCNRRETTPISFPSPDPIQTVFPFYSGFSSVDLPKRFWKLVS